MTLRSVDVDPPVSPVHWPLIVMTVMGYRHAIPPTLLTESTMGADVDIDFDWAGPTRAFEIDFSVQSLGTCSDIHPLCVLGRFTHRNTQIDPVFQQFVIFTTTVEMSSMSINDYLSLLFLFFFAASRIPSTFAALGISNSISNCRIDFVRKSFNKRKIERKL